MEHFIKILLEKLKDTSSENEKPENLSANTLL